MELNPNHPVTGQMHDHWHKIAALLMLHFGKNKVVISTNEVSQMQGKNITIRFDDEIGIELCIVGDEEAAAIARREGGLPV